MSKIKMKTLSISLPTLNKLVYASFLWMTPLFMVGQGTTETVKDTVAPNQGTLEVDQVEVIKAFDAHLADAQRITLSPSIQPVVPIQKSYDYNITIVPLDIDYPEPVIKPLAMTPEAPMEVHKFYARLGYGDLSSPYADLSYHGKKGDAYDYTISAHYYGADDSEEVRFRKFHESDLTLNFGYLLGENHKINVDFMLGFDKRNLYDTAFVSPNPLLLEEDVERTIFRTKMQAGIETIEPTEANFRYGMGVFGQRIQFNSILDAYENGFGINVFVDNQLSSHLTLFVKGDAAFHSITYPSDNSNNRKALSLNPGLRFSLGSFSLDAAADLFVDDFQTSPFVDIKATYSLTENGLQLYAGVNQVPIANTLWNHYLNNPFVSGSIPINKTTLSKQFFGGLSGKIRDFLTFDFMGGYADIKDQYYYDDLALLRLWVRHTDMTNIFINANIDFQISDQLKLGANASQNFYSPEELEILPNTPEYKYTAYAEYKLFRDKLVVTSDLHLMDRISFIDDLENIQLGNAQIDLSLGLDVYAAKNIGLWFRANNLLDRTYLRFSNYPEFGRNILGGLWVKF